MAVYYFFLDFVDVVLWCNGGEASLVVVGEAFAVEASAVEASESYLVTAGEAEVEASEDFS